MLWWHLWQIGGVRLTERENWRKCQHSQQPFWPPPKMDADPTNPFCILPTVWKWSDTSEKATILFSFELEHLQGRQACLRSQMLSYLQRIEEFNFNFFSLWLSWVVPLFEMRAALPRNWREPFRPQITTRSAFLVHERDSRMKQSGWNTFYQKLWSSWWG